MGEKMAEKFCRKWRLPRHFWVVLHAVKLDMGQTALLPLRRKVCSGIFRPKNPTVSAGFEPANSGTKGPHATTTPPKSPFLKTGFINFPKSFIGDPKTEFSRRLTEEK
jgi:hypothetical protein